MTEWVHKPRFGEPQLKLTLEDLEPAKSTSRSNGHAPAITAVTVRTAIKANNRKLADPIGEALGKVAGELRREWQREDTARQDATMTYIRRLEARVGQLERLEKHIEELQRRTVHESYQGVWRAGRLYHKGNSASHKGGTWIARRDTHMTPGEPDSGWTLAVKAGRNGRDYDPHRDDSERPPRTDRSNPTTIRR